MVGSFNSRSLFSRDAAVEMLEVNFESSRRSVIASMAIVFCSTAIVIGAARCVAQESPTDSLKTLHAADGVDVTLWASEPMVENPTSMDIDSRGRVWISEGLNYRMKQRSFETMQRVEGADRIKILSDTNGDGTADSVTVFADNLFPVPLGLAIQEIWKDGKQTGTRVYVGQSPDLLVIEDIDGDDQADRRYELLSGFRGVDSDHGLHGMTFGPDGKLYFTVGDTRYGADKVQAREPTFDVTDKSGRRLSESNFGTTLRVNPDGTQLEVLSSGHRNNYEATVDSFGNVFGSDNDDDGNRGCRMYWVMDGGRYGYQHPKSSRHWAEELPGIIPKLVGTGNGAPGGVVVYEGDMLPGMYIGAVLQIDSGTHQVNAHPLVRHGAGFRSDYQVLLNGEDAWFRPVDLSVAPDGSLFVCDWYDAGVGGNRFSDQTTGRIYRLSSDRKKPASKPGSIPENPVEALQSANASTRLAARELLIGMGDRARQPLLTLFRDGRPSDRARALNVLFDLPETGAADTIAALGDTDARLRELALQLLARDLVRESVIGPAEAKASPPPATKWLPQILALADDPDAGVRRALLMALRNVPTRDAGEALLKMAGSWDGRDRYYLESLRAALINREPDFLRHLFGYRARRAVESGWNATPIALPPYYPIGTNDAFLKPQDQLPPSNAASRVAGLAWALQRPESLPALKHILAQNQSPSVEQATMIALAAIEDSAAGQMMIERYLADTVDFPKTADLDRKRDILRRLGAGVTGAWSDLASSLSLKKVFTSAFKDPALTADAAAAIAAGKVSGFGEPLMGLAQDPSQPTAVRVTALTSLGKLKYAPVADLAQKLVATAQGKRSGGPIAIAAIETLQSVAGRDALNSLQSNLVDVKMPLDVRRRALQIVTATSLGAETVLSQHQAGALPDDLGDELSFLLHNHSDRRIRSIAAKQMPIKYLGDGKKIHDVQTVLAIQGDASRGSELFKNHKDAACSRCHHVSGEGNLVGPDLASIGMKYGDKELLYHIQFPSGAINYNFVSHQYLLDDGRVLIGLPIERKDDQITIGIATGQQVTFAADAVEEERVQTVSLMPEGLVAKFTAQQLSDLVEYLLTLRQGDAVVRQ